MSALSVTREMEGVIPKKYRGVFKYKTIEGVGSIPELKYWVDKNAEKRLTCSMRKQAVFTDCSSWTTEKIVKANKSKYLIEDDFKWIKDKNTNKVELVLEDMHTLQAKLFSRLNLGRYLE